MSITEYKINEIIKNRYLVLSVLNQGGMGILYHVSDLAKEKKSLALKTLRLDTSGEQKALIIERFRYEFSLLSQLSHYNLVSVHNFGIIKNDEFYFTMDWIEGPSLEEMMPEIKPDHIIPTIIQICRALAYLHSRGIIHGDLKPSNILFLKNERIKIIDFGLAFDMKSEGNQIAYYSPDYTAPEIRQHNPIDHRVDLYSLGAIWYKILTGEQPPAMFDSEYIIDEALNDIFDSHNHSHPKIKIVIRKLLAKIPTDRYATANEVIQAINRFTGSSYKLETRETATSYALRSRFIGHEEELTVIQGLWEDAVSNEGKIVFINGESGVGKTRLLKEVSIRAELNGAHVIRGECIEDAGVAYLPWLEVLRVIIRYIEHTVEGKKAMVQLGPILATLYQELWERDYMHGLSLPAELDPQSQQRRLNDAIIQILRTAAKLRPTLLIVEDIHWADEATLALLDFLARITDLTGLMFCFTYRSNEVTDDSILNTLSGENIHRFTIKALTKEETTALLNAMLGLHEVPALLIERLLEVTGGNAFFIQEIVRSMAEEGVILQRTVDGWRIDHNALQKMQLPDSIHQVVLRRLNQLSDATRRFFQNAALVGQVFWGGIVKEIADISDISLHNALHELINQELIFERDVSTFDDEKEYVFIKPSVHEVCYKSFPEKGKHLLHRGVANWLIERSNENTNVNLGLIADHLEKAGEASEALKYLINAGKLAVSRFANAEAIDYLSRALSLLPEDAISERYNLLLLRESAYNFQGTRKAQLQDLIILQDLAKTLDNNQKQAEITLRMANYADVTSDYPAVIKSVRNVIQIARSMSEKDESSIYYQALGHHIWGRALRFQGNYSEAEVHLEKAIVLAESISLHQIAGKCLYNLARVIFSGKGNFKKARYHLEKALPITREIGDKQAETICLHGLGIITRAEGDFSTSIASFEQSIHIDREIGDRHGIPSDLAELGKTFYAIGDYEKASRNYEMAMDILKEIGDRTGEARVLGYMGLLFYQLGEDETAKEYGEKAVKLTNILGLRDFQAEACYALGHVYISRGDTPKALDSYKQALTIRQELGQQHLTIEPLAGIAYTLLTEGAIEQAEKHVREILNFQENHTIEGIGEVIKIYLTCYKVLKINQGQRAKNILVQAHNLLQERASKLKNKDIQYSFLNNIASHQEIIKEYALYS